MHWVKSSFCFIFVHLLILFQLHTLKTRQNAHVDLLKRYDIFFSFVLDASRWIHDEKNSLSKVCLNIRGIHLSSFLLFKLKSTNLIWFKFTCMNTKSKCGTILFESNVMYFKSNHPMICRFWSKQMVVQSKWPISHRCISYNSQKLGQGLLRWR